MKKNDDKVFTVHTTMFVELDKDGNPVDHYIENVPPYLDYQIKGAIELARHVKREQDYHVITKSEIDTVITKTRPTLTKERKDKVELIAPVDVFNKLVMNGGSVDVDVIAVSMVTDTYGNDAKVLNNDFSWDYSDKKVIGAVHIARILKSNIAMVDYEKGRLYGERLDNIYSVKKWGNYLVHTVVTSKRLFDNLSKADLSWIWDV